MIYVATKNHLLSRGKSDKAVLLLDAGDFIFDQSDPGLVVQDQKFMIHPKSNPDTDTI